jgi:tetratricopeptide (TPR) repeat protein
MQGPAFKEIEKKRGGIEAYKTVGSQRIFIELEGKPEEAAKYAKKYNALVSVIVERLKSEGIAPATEEKFFTKVWKAMAATSNEKKFFREMWNVMNSTFGIKYGENNFLSESLDTKKWDCENSAFLVFDVGRALGVKLEIINVPRHAFVAGNRFYFETTDGEYHPIKRLLEKYPLVYGRSAKDAEVMTTAYFNRGIVRKREGRDEEAIKDFSRVIAINPKDGGAYVERGLIYDEAGQYEKAIAEYTKAIEIDPNDGVTYYSRGNAYQKEKRYGMAMGDYIKAAKLMRTTEPIRGWKEVFNHMGDIYRELGRQHEAIGCYSELIEMDMALAKDYIKKRIVCEAEENDEEALGHSLKAEEKAAEAFGYSLKLAEMGTELEHALHGRGLAYESIGEKEKAKEDFDNESMLKKGEEKADEDSGNEKALK